MQHVAYDLSNLQVLVVEDNRFMQLLLRNILQQFKIRSIRTVADGADGLSEMKGFAPDLVICDWEMEVLDGLEFTRLVRTSKDSQNPYVPILMLTAHTEAYRVMEARDAGITEFLAKPISAAQVYDRICRIIDHPRQFVSTKTFFGPDRRRSKPNEKTNRGRRKEDKEFNAGVDEADKIMAEGEQAPAET